MNLPKQQNNFSKTFCKYKGSKIKSDIASITFESPFSFLDYYLKEEDKSIELNKFETGFSIHMDLQNQIKACIQLFRV